jgi:hypothetical protein
MPANVQTNGDGTASFTTTCVVCRKTHRFTEDKEKVMRWLYGDYIQNVFPEKSADEREMMVSGTCPECFDKLFPPDPDECNGMCMTGADVGLPEYGHLIAYAHPDCPIHGDKSEDS